MAEMLTPESLTPVADTRHPKLDPPANHPVSVLSLRASGHQSL